MNRITKNPCKPYCLLAVAVIALAVSHATAATYTWNKPAGNGSSYATRAQYDWNTSANWDTADGTDYPKVAGDVAHVLSGSGDLGINLNVPITIGSATFGYNSQNWYLDPGTAGTLTFDNGGSNAVIDGTSTRTTKQFQWNAPMYLNSDLELVGNSNGEIHMRGSISDGANGPKQIIISGGGASFSGDSSFSGGIKVESGTLQLSGSGNTQLGTGKVIMGDFGDVGTLGIWSYANRFSTTQLANAIDINQDFTYSTYVNRNCSTAFNGATTLNGTRTITVSKGTEGNPAFILGGPISDGPNPGGLIKAGAGPMILGGANTYTGDTTVNAGTLNMNGSLLMDINDGDSNQLLGDGTLILDGALNLDVADVTGSGNWLLVDVDNLTETYDTGFSVAMNGGATFAEASDVWTYSDVGGDWTFTEGTGYLDFAAAATTVIPEPSSFIAFGSLALLGLAWFTRRRKR